MINKVILVGNLTRDPQYKSTSRGETVALLNLATNEHWTDKETGEKKSKAEFHRITVFGKLADVCRQLNLGTASMLYIEGQLTHRSYEQNGETKYITEVKLSGFKSAIQLLDRKGEPKGEVEIGEVFEPKPSEIIQPVELDEDFEDDIPF